MIYIGKPYIDRENEWTRLCSDVEIGGKQSTMWIAVEPEYEKYLTVERADAFVVALLTAAMTRGEDITCDGYITRRLKYQINQYLIPSLASNMESYHPIKVIGDCADDKLECENAVATGWTGGVDCMFTLFNHSSLNSDVKITHLMVANNGAIEGGKFNKIFTKMLNKAKTGVAADYGLKVVGIDSNLHLVLNESFLKVSDFRHAASILALQKLFGVYLNSASYEFEALKFVPENCSYYELLLMQCFETDCTVFYSSGGHTPRIMKLKQMEDFGPAQKYLHPCIYATRDNCGICGKCIRTQGGLFALGILDKFGDVFDLNAFEENKDTIFRQIIANRNNNKHCDEILQLLADSNDNFIQNMMRKEKTLNVVVTVAMRFQKQNKDKESKGEA